MSDGLEVGEGDWICGDALIPGVTVLAGNFVGVAEGLGFVAV